MIQGVGGVRVHSGGAVVCEKGAGGRDVCVHTHTHTWRMVVVVVGVFLENVCFPVSNLVCQRACLVRAPIHETLLSCLHRTR